MKKNDMLNESTIRRFMKLATIDGLTDKFVAENLDETTEEVEEGRMRAKRDDEDEMREGEEELDEMRGDKDKEEMDEAADEELEETVEDTVDEVALEEEEMEMDMEMDAEPEAAGGMVSVDQLMSALEKALEDVLGQEVEVSQDGEEEMDMDMDVEEPADLDMDMADAGEEMDAEEEEEDLEETTIQPDVVEEVFARVIQRLTQETKSNEE